MARVKPEDSLRRKVFKRVEDLPDGSLILIDDFLDIGSNATVRQYIQQLYVKEKKLFRIGHGIYQKPKYSELLKEYVVPSADEIAEVLARKNGWKIAHGVERTLNELGLSTHVPAKNVYIYDRRGRCIQVGDYKLYFFRDERINYFSPDVFPIVVAVATLGRHNLGDKEIRILSRRLNSEQKERLLDELEKLPEELFFPEFYKNAIRKICTLEESA